MRSLLVTSAIVGAFVLVGSSVASAANSEILKVNVPFPFVVNGQSFPAGHYLIEEDSEIGPAVLLIKGMNTPSAAFMLTRPAAGERSSREPALLFNRYENQYRLSGVWESATEGQTIIQSR